jgi:ferric-chelate reductase
MLMDIATAASDSSIDLHISIYVTCLCDPEAVPAIPNSIVILSRPSVHGLLASFINLPCEKDDSIETQSDEIQKHSGGGVAVCASGPESMTREAQNAVARIGLTASMEVGGIALHTELFSM